MKRKRSKQRGEYQYWSQNEETCSIDAEHGCGPCSLANALIIKKSAVASPLDICFLARKEGIFRDSSTGITPRAFARLVHVLLEATPLVEIKSGGGQELRPGCVLFVSSVGLKNAQGLCEFEGSVEHDGHIVVVENVTTSHVVVINPDTKPTSKCARSTETECRCFEDGKCGRMRISKDAIDAVCFASVSW